MKMRLLNLLALFVLLSGMAASGCTGVLSAGDSEKVPLVVFAAGSLITPFGELEKAFENSHPGIDVQAEYHGSVQVMRHATELHEPIDVVATADASLIPMLMYTMTNPDTGSPYATWYIRFASNHLALAYQPGSLYADEINDENWYDILVRPGVRVGIADPRFDATGYRALMVYALAQEYYGVHTIFTNMFDGAFTYPLGIFTEGDQSIVTVPEILETVRGSHILVRGASIELIALLESGDLDYAFEYESVIKQHDLQLLDLPAELDLGEAGYDPVYERVTVSLEFRRFASVEPEFVGERIGYGITIPGSAPHPSEAAQFISFLLGPEGHSIMQENDHPLFDPALGYEYDKIPASLQELCEPQESP